MVSDVEEKQICCPFSAGDLKAALIHVLVILRVDQITVCFFKRIACGYEVTENHHSTRQLLSALWIFFKPLMSSFFWSYGTCTV